MQSRLRRRSGDSALTAARSNTFSSIPVSSSLPGRGHEQVPERGKNFSLVGIGDHVPLPEKNLHSSRALLPSQWVICSRIFLSRRLKLYSTSRNPPAFPAV